MKDDNERTIISVDRSEPIYKRYVIYHDDYWHESPQRRGHGILIEFTSNAKKIGYWNAMTMELQLEILIRLRDYRSFIRNENTNKTRRFRKSDFKNLFKSSKYGGKLKLLLM